MDNINNSSPLLFFGRGSAFSSGHNSAFFETDNTLVIIDCSVTSIPKIRQLQLEGYKEIFIVVTHSHCDHVSGIPLFAEFMHFILNKKLRIIVPCDEVGRNLDYVLLNMEGCSKDWYTIERADLVEEKWLLMAVPTDHVPGLSGKCFGYVFNVGESKIVYTGDTATIEPFKPYIDGDTILYSEIATFDSGVHLYYEGLIPYLKCIADNGTKVYLMHIDNEEKIKELISGTQLLLAPLI